MGATSPSRVAPRTCSDSPATPTGPPDIFLHDRDQDGNGVFDEPGGIATTRVSVGPGGLQGVGPSGGGGFAWGAASISADAQAVAFPSAAENLVPGDANAAVDAFVRRTCGPPPMTYCTSQVNSLGCTPAITIDGVPSSSSGSGFTLSVADVLNDSMGMLFYSTSGAASLPLGGGLLCLQSPLTRTFLLDSGGSPTGLDCSGTLAIDFNLFASSGVDPSLVAGVQVWSQFMSRDPGAALGMNLSDAASFELCD